MRCDKHGHCVNKLFMNCSARPEWTCSDKILCHGEVCSRRGADDTTVTDQSSECDDLPTFRQVHYINYHAFIYYLYRKT